MLEVKNLYKRYPIASGIFRVRGFVDAVQNVSFKIQPGEIVSLVGESGSGKTTVGKMIQGLIEPTSGDILLNGENASLLSRAERAHWVQTIFQDPFASLNPKLSVGTMLGEALKHSLEFRDLSLETKHKEPKRLNSKLSTLNSQLSELLESVGLPTNILHDYPHQFSGGQRQRLGIARALAMHPKLIIADEPVSALDLSIQAQILKLLMDLKEKFGISYLLIAHDLSVVERISDSVLVMQNGKIVEQGPVDSVFNHAKEPYTSRLLSAMLTLP